VFLCCFRWRLTALNCPDNLYDLSLDDVAIQIYVLGECNVLSEPHEGANMREFYCSPMDGAAFENCNVTGQWDIYDPAIRSMCLDYWRKNFYVIR